MALFFVFIRLFTLRETAIILLYKIFIYFRFILLGNGYRFYSIARIDILKIDILTSGALWAGMYKK